MLTFDLDQNAGRLRIAHPEAVDEVVETERRGQAGLKAIAEVVFRNGSRYTVLDPERTVAEQIHAAAQEQSRARSLAQERVAKALETLGLQAV